MTVHETRCCAAHTWSYVLQLLFHIPEAIWLIVFAAHTGICREEHADKYLDYIMRTVLVETDRKTIWRAQLMEQLLGWLGSDGCALWMRPGGSVRLSIWDAEVPPGSMHKVALLCSKVTTSATHHLSRVGSMGVIVARGSFAGAVSTSASSAIGSLLPTTQARSPTRVAEAAHWHFAAA